MNGSIKDAARTLSRMNASGLQETKVAGYTAVRLGRNVVWKLTPRSGGESLCLKFPASREHFQRELRGLRVASSLADEEASFTSPEVLWADENVPAIVTTYLLGPTLTEIFSQAFRLDRNPWRRRVLIARAMKCVEKSIRWLEAFSRRKVEVDPSLLDHSIAGISERMLYKLEKLENRNARFGDASSVPFEKLKELCQAASSKIEPSAPVTVFGDPTSGNFLFHQGGVAAIDFEDFGLGDPARDWVAFHDSLLPPHGRWMYWPCRKLREVIKIPQEPAAKVAFLRLELALHRHITRTAAGINARRILLNALRDCEVALQSETDENEAVVINTSR